MEIKNVRIICRDTYNKEIAIIGIITLFIINYLSQVIRTLGPASWLGEYGNTLSISKIPLQYFVGYGWYLALMWSFRTRRLSKHHHHPAFSPHCAGLGLNVRWRLSLLSPHNSSIILSFCRSLATVQALTLKRLTFSNGGTLFLRSKETWADLCLVAFTLHFFVKL